MKIDFYIDYGEDLRYILTRLTHLDPAGLDSRLKTKEIPIEVVRNILGAQGEQEKRRLLNQFLKNYYQENLSNFEKVKSEYQGIWKDKVSPFFSTITQIMGARDWKYNYYLFLVSSFFSRAQWGKGNRLAVWWKREPQKYWFLNGYELILSHVFEIVDQIYKKRPLSDWQMWALAETSAYILVYREERIKKIFWPQLNEPHKFSYPQLLKHIEKLTFPYKKSSHFDHFLKEGIDYFKDFSIEKITQPTDD